MFRFIVKSGTDRAARIGATISASDMVGRTLRVSRSSSDGSAGMPRPTCWTTLKFLYAKIIAAGIFILCFFPWALPAGEVNNGIDNGSFESVVNDNYPLTWAYRYEGSGCNGGGLIPEYVKAKVNKDQIPSMIVDSSTAAVGTKSLKINNPSANLMIAGAQNWMRHLKPNQTYTISIYLKSDKQGEGQEVAVDLGNFFNAKCKVTTEWKRYTWTFKTSAEGSPSFQIWWRSAGALWIDGVQLEEGETVHDYVEKPYEN